MKKQTLNALNEEEYKKQEIIDSWKHIKDLEAELEFLYSREPQEKKYIEHIKNIVDNLYKKVDTLQNEIN